ncbi:MAG TPA: hypothetical protein VIK01_08665 [Polyangiaceae bacterium]
MRWYISSKGDTIGPIEGSEVIDRLRTARVDSDAFFRDEASAAWVPITQTPFANSAAGASAAAAPLVANAPTTPVQPPSGGEGLGYAILAAPFFSGVLVWLWIANMNLLQDPSGSLLFLSVVTILGTAILMSVEASQLGMGTRDDSRGKKGTGPVAWFFGACLCWILVFPWYLAQRRLYGRKSLVLGGIAVALFFVGSSGAVGAAIESRKAQIRANLESFALPATLGGSSRVGVAPDFSMDRIKQKVATDAVNQYNMAKRGGSAVDVCVHAGFVAAAYLQANDETNYQAWKQTQKTDCQAAGVPGL